MMIDCPAARGFPQLHETLMVNKFTTSGGMRRC